MRKKLKYNALEDTIFIYWGTIEIDIILYLLRNYVQKVYQKERNKNL